MVDVIAEIGINHNGSLNKAISMINVAHYCGAKYAKFQTYLTEKRVSNNDVITPILRKCELSYDDFVKLKAHCDSIGIEFLSTPFDEESLNALVHIGCRKFKISSFDVTNHALLRLIAATKPEHVIMSTGMATLSEIEHAIDTLRDSYHVKLTLMHCVSAYPTEIEQAQLSNIVALKNEFGSMCSIGYSDHTVGIDVALSAVAAGAELIEKHFMLNNDYEAPDAPVSINPTELGVLVRKLRELERMFGTPQFGVKKCEAATARYRHFTK